MSKIPLWFCLTFICYNFYQVPKRKSSSSLYSVFMIKKERTKERKTIQLDNTFLSISSYSKLGPFSQKLFSDSHHLSLYFISSPSNLWNSLWDFQNNEDNWSYICRGEKRKQKPKLQVVGSRIGFGGHLFSQRALNVFTTGWFSTRRKMLSCVQSWRLINSSLCPQTFSLTQHQAESRESCFWSSSSSCNNWLFLVACLSFRVFVNKIWVIPSLAESLE